METGEDPVRARRRKVQKVSVLPEAAVRGQIIGYFPRRCPIRTKSEYLAIDNSQNVSECLTGI